MNTRLHQAVLLLLCLLSAFSARGELRVEVVPAAGGQVCKIADGQGDAFLPVAEEGLRVRQPAGEMLISFPGVKEESGGSWRFTDGRAPGLMLTDAYRALGPELLERVVTVTAESDQRYTLDLGWRCPRKGVMCSFTGPEEKAASYTPGCGGPEFGGGSLQTFPFLGLLSEGRLYGVIGDTPGLWENRSFMAFDPATGTLSLTNGDGSPKRVIAIPTNVDATTVYRTRFDGWQHIEAGETQTFTTWVFASPAKTQYDVQLAAHLALANAKGFNGSAVEAILRNTSYLLLRRNLLRPESDYLFISGVGYGWKQWVSDGFWMSRGLDDPRYDAEAQAAVFYERIHYEDNAQYYLIWSALVKRAGGSVDMRTVDRAYQFIRSHEVDGLYRPPRLTANSIIMRTYHDQLPYEDGDAQSSNQGFHCGALMAARELGYPVTEEDIQRARDGYARIFNREGGYMATSLMQQDHVGQDGFYGAVLTYCVFGEKTLPDDLVLAHLETTMRIQSPYGMRVISNADGSLLEGHTGVYTHGGSWFLNDAANYLAGLIHGMDPAWVDEKLLWRLEKELAFMPAFHESISTVHGKPHGHHLYSWNSGFWWLRRETRARMGMDGPDPLYAALDAKLGVKREGETLVFTPGNRTYP